MAAQVKMNSVAGERAGITSTLPFGSLTDSDNKGAVDASRDTPKDLTPERGKPVTGTKPRLTPKPFSLDLKQLTRPIVAPKPKSNLVHTTSTPFQPCSDATDQKNTSEPIQPEISNSDPSSFSREDSPSSAKSVPPNTPKSNLPDTPHLNPPSPGEPSTVNRTKLDMQQPQQTITSNSNLCSVPKPVPQASPKLSRFSIPNSEPVSSPKPKPDLPSTPKPDRSSVPKPKLPCTPKPDQDRTFKPKLYSSLKLDLPVAIKTDPSSEIPSNKPNSPQSPEEPARLTVSERVKRLLQSQSPQKSPAAEWSGITQQEKDQQQEKQKDGGKHKGGASISRTKSMGFLNRVGWTMDKEGDTEQETADKKKKSTVQPHRNGSIMLQSPASQNQTSSSPTTTSHWTGKRLLSSNLTSKFEPLSCALQHHDGTQNVSESRGTEDTNSKEMEQVAHLMTPTILGSTVKPSALDGQEGGKEKAKDFENASTSIKKRISLLFDSSSQAGGASDPDHPSAQPIPEVDISVGVKQRIKQLTADTTSDQILPQRTQLKPRPLSQDLTKHFTARASTETSSPSTTSPEKAGARSSREIEHTLFVPAPEEVEPILEDATKSQKEQDCDAQPEMKDNKVQQEERHRSINELEKQQEVERQKQIYLELERQREAERQMEMEMELERQREAERQKQVEMELQRQREAERQKQVEMELQRQREAERQKQVEMELARQQEAERQKQIEMELERQREADRQKQVEMELQRQREAERQKQVEMELERQREADRQKQVEMELQRQREAERQKQVEMELQRQREAERQKKIEMELQRQREAERQKQVEMELERQREAERQKQIEMELQRQREAERQKQVEMELERQREAERQKQIEMELQRQREADRQKQVEMELERQREAERQKQVEMELARQQEAERQKQIEMELERQREAERQKQIEMELERQREAERQKQIEMELQRQREAERQKQVEMELERQREAERQKQVEMELERQREAERQKQVEMELERQREKIQDREWKHQLIPKSSGMVLIQQTPLQTSGGEEDDVAHVAEQVIYDDFSVKSRRWGYMRKSLPMYRKSSTDTAFCSSQSLVPEDDDDNNKENDENIEQRWGDQRRRQEIIENEDHAETIDKWTENVEKEREQDVGNLQDREIASDAAECHNFQVENNFQEVKAEDEKTLLSSKTPPQPHLKPGAESTDMQDGLRKRSYSMTHSSQLAENLLEGSLARARSRSIQRMLGKEEEYLDPTRQGEEEEGCRDTDRLIQDTNRYGSLNTPEHSDDRLISTALTDNSSTSTGQHGVSQDTPESPCLSPSVDTEALPFPETPTSLLDSSALRSKVQLFKRRKSQRAPPSRQARQRAVLAVQQDGSDAEWRFYDSTDKRDESEEEEEEEEEEMRPRFLPIQRVPLFPGMDPSVLKAQLKKRESDSPAEQPQPTAPRSSKSPFLPQAAKVLPPAGGKENSGESSPQWLQELKSKKLFSQNESDI